MTDDDAHLDAELDQPADLPPPPPGTQQCGECTILIGPGYIETRPLMHPSRPGIVCGMCYESLERRAERRRAAEQRGEPPRVEPLDRWWARRRGR
jgi:hypothetical protein